MNTDTISLIGLGNVGSQLYRSFLENEVRVSHVFSRSSKSLDLNQDSMVVNTLDALPKKQLTLLCVPDGEIRSLIQNIDPEIPVAYTSGSVSLDSFSNRTHVGVFYPLQTFSKGREIAISKVPFFIEADSAVYEKKLVLLAKKLSDHVSIADSEQRKKLHLTAVWVNNFTNHILMQAKAYADEQQVNFEHLKPLLEETVRKLDGMSPYDAQTGPARRGDQQTIDTHLNELTGIQKELYALISKSIQQAYKK